MENPIATTKCIRILIHLLGKVFVVEELNCLLHHTVLEVRRLEILLHLEQLHTVLNLLLHIIRISVRDRRQAVTSLTDLFSYFFVNAHLDLNALRHSVPDVIAKGLPLCAAVLHIAAILVIEEHLHNGGDVMMRAALVAEANLLDLVDDVITENLLLRLLVIRLGPLVQATNRQETTALQAPHRSTDPVPLELLVVVG